MAGVYRVMMYLKHVVTSQAAKSEALYRLASEVGRGGSGTEKRADKNPNRFRTVFAETVRLRVMCAIPDTIYHISNGSNSRRNKKSRALRFDQSRTAACKNFFLCVCLYGYQERERASDYHSRVARRISNVSTVEDPRVGWSLGGLLPRRRLCANANEARNALHVYQRLLVIAALKSLLDTAGHGLVSCSSYIYHCYEFTRTTFRSVQQ